MNILSHAETCHLHLHGNAFYCGFGRGCTASLRWCSTPFYQNSLAEGGVGANRHCGGGFLAGEFEENFWNQGSKLKL
ncbi:MAG: hypothetical protein MI685_09140 [Chlorobiales bacterium]|nr:hypothetical protein [Chlorobiales bacterium]